MYVILCGKGKQGYFVPDTIDQAEKEGFAPCSHCIGKAT